MNIMPHQSLCEVSNESNNNQDKRSKKEEILRRNDKILTHASQCRDANCRQRSCLKMKNVLKHTKCCAKRKTEQCSLCKSVFSLYCHHGLNCTDETCAISFCREVKQKLLNLQKVSEQQLGSQEKPSQSSLPVFQSVQRPRVDVKNMFATDDFNPVNHTHTMVIKNNHHSVNGGINFNQNEIMVNKSCKVKSQWSLKYQHDLTLTGANVSQHLNALPIANVGTTLVRDESLYQPTLAQFTPPSGDLCQTFLPIELQHLRSRDYDKRELNVSVSTNSFFIKRQRTAAPDGAKLFDSAPSFGDKYSFAAANNMYNNIPADYNNVEQQNFPDYNNIEDHFARSEFYRQNADYLNQAFLQQNFPPYYSVMSSFVEPPPTSSRRTVIVNNLVPDSKENMSNIGLGTISSSLLDAVENAVDYPYNFTKDYLNQCSSLNNDKPNALSGNSLPADPLVNNNNNNNISTTVQLNDDDDDDDSVIEIIAEVKNVEVIAELPKSETSNYTKHGTKRRRIYKETKAVAEAAEEDLTCCVCLKPFETPVLCFDCKKITGCKKCIEGWGAHCPACRGTSGYTVVRGLDKISAKLREYDDVLFID